VLYDERSLDGAHELIKGWSAKDRQTMRDTVPRLALQAEIGGRTVQDVAKDMLALSRAGLGRRGRLGCKGRTEAQFLDVLDEIAETGRTRAEDLLGHYDSDWNGDVTRVFRDFAF
jgi:glutamate--cysteine ligase